MGATEGNERVLDGGGVAGASPDDGWVGRSVTHRRPESVKNAHHELIFGLPHPGCDVKTGACPPCTVCT